MVECVEYRIKVDQERYRVRFDLQAGTVSVSPALSQKTRTYPAQFQSGAQAELAIERFRNDEAKGATATDGSGEPWDREQLVLDLR